MAAVAEIPSYLNPTLVDRLQKPQHPVTIDKTNPLTVGLYDYNICQLSHAVAQSSNANILKDGGSPGYNVNARTDQGFDTSMRAISVAPVHSVVVVWSQTSFADIYAGGDTLYSERPNATQIFKVVIRSGNTLSCVYRNSSGTGLINLPVGAAIDTNRTLHVGTLVKRADNLRDFYCDGSTATLGTSSGGTYNYVLPRISSDPQDGNAGANESYIHAVYTWDRALTVDEVKSIEAAPYGLLKPAASLYYFTGAAPPAGASKSQKNLSLMGAG